MVMLPSEKARLVLGYLREQECYQAYKEFLVKSPHLKELRGMIRKGTQPHEYEWKLRGLSRILDDYSSIECSICALQVNSDILTQLEEANSIVKKVQCLLDFVRKHSNRLQSTSKCREQIFNENISKTAQSTKYFKNKRKSSENQCIPNSSMTVHNGIPIINNIPESIVSDESTDVCNLSFSPMQLEKTIIANDIEKSTANQLSVSSDTFIKKLNSKCDGKKEMNKSITKNKNDSKMKPMNLDDGVDVTFISETLLERTDIQEKIAENINKLYLSSVSKNDNKTSLESQSPLKSIIQTNDKVTSNEIDLEMHLNNVIRDIVNATEKDHAFDELLDQLVEKVAEVSPSSTSEDSSPNRPTTSTPEHASGKIKKAILDTSTSPVKRMAEVANSSSKYSKKSEEDGDQEDDSIKSRLRSNSKQKNDHIANSSNHNKGSGTLPITDDTPQKSSKQDLLAMAINDADVSGSLRKMNASLNKNDNKIVILSNEVVHRNLNDFNITNSNNNGLVQNKIGNVAINNENSISMNTHFILPAINTNNMFLNTNMPQYLVTGNSGDDDHNKLFLINTAPLTMPVQNNVNNEITTDVMTMPTFLVLPQQSQGTSVLNEPTAIAYQPVSITKKPKAVILPQPEKCKVQQKNDSSGKSFSDVILIREDSEQLPNLVLPKMNLNLTENKTENNKNFNDNLKIDNNSRIDKNNDSTSKEISATKVIDLVKDDTPDISTMQIKERTSLSTPRRRKSHVRVLDFNTPPKMNCSRKAITSPKSAFMRRSPKTEQKIFKISSHTKEPIRSALFKSPKSKISYVTEVNDNKSSAKKNKRIQSPAIKLSGGWDEVQGLGMIVGDKKQNIISNNLLLECKTDKEIIISTKSNINQETTSSRKVPEQKDTKDCYSETEKVNTKRVVAKNKWDSDLRALVQTKTPVIRCTRLRSKLLKSPNTSQIKKTKQIVKSNSASSKKCKQISKPNTNKIDDFKLPNLSEEHNKFETIINKENGNGEKIKEKKDFCPVEKINNKSEIYSDNLINDTTNSLHNSNFNKEVNKDKKENLTDPIKESVAIAITNNEEPNVKKTKDKVLDVAKDFEKQSTEICPEENNKKISSSISIEDESAVFMTTDNLLKMKQSITMQEKSNIVEQTVSKVQTSGFINFEDMDNSKQRCELKLFSEQNCADSMQLLETPYKLEEGSVPKTPRFLQASQIEDTPFTKIKRSSDFNSLVKCGLPTPNFPLTPSISASSTPDNKVVDETGKDESDKTATNSYYKPDQSSGLVQNSNKEVYNPLKIREENKNCNVEKENKSEDMDISSNSCSSSSSCTSSDSYSSSSSSSSQSNDSSFNSSTDNSLNLDKSIKLDNNSKTTNVQQSPKKTSIETISEILSTCNASKEAGNSKRTEENNISFANAKLLRELDEKRLRILKKVQADLAFKPVKPAFKKRGKVAQIKPKIKAIKTNINRNNDKFLSKEKLEEKNFKGVVKSRRKSDSPRKRCLPEVSSKSIDINIIQKNHRLIIKPDDILDTSFPILQLSEDESENGNPEIAKCQNNFKDTEPVKELVLDHISENKADQIQTITTENNSLPANSQPKSNDNFNIKQDDDSDDECSFEFSLQQNNAIEECTENAKLRTQKNVNDGFDPSSFKVNIGEEGILTISPLVTLLHINPEQQEKKQTQSVVTDKSKKKKNRKTPLNILFETAFKNKEDAQENTAKENETEQNTISGSTPCANLYEESPKGKYDNKKEIKKITKNLDLKRNKDETEEILQKKVNHKERSLENKSQQSSSSIKEDKASKRKRTDDNDIFLNKKIKPCNPQELIKNVDLDYLLDVIHGKQ